MTDPRPESDPRPLEADLFGERVDEEPDPVPRRRSSSHLLGQSTIKPIGEETTLEPGDDAGTYSLAGDVPSTHAPIEPTKRSTAPHESTVVPSRGEDMDEESTRGKRRRGKRSRLTGLGTQLTVFLACGSLFALGMSAIRLLADDLGRSPTVSTAILGAILASVAVGGIVGGRLVGLVSPRRLLPAILVAASGGCVLVLVLDESVGGWNRGEFSLEVWSAYVAGLLLFVPATLLGAVLPTAGEIAMRRSSHDGTTLGDLFACGALGGVVGAAVTGFLLIDVLGTRGTIWAVAGVLAIAAVVAAAGMQVFRAVVCVGWLQFLVYFGLVACATPDSFAGIGQGIGIVLSHREAAEPARERQRRWSEQFANLGRSLKAFGLTLGLRDDTGTFFDESDHSTIRIRTDEAGMRTLEIDGVVRGRFDSERPGELQGPFNRLAAAIVAATTRRATRANDRALFLGGGTFALPRWYEKQSPEARVVVVEPDAVIVSSARRLFELPDDPGERLQVVVDDPRAYVQRPSDAGDGDENRTRFAWVVVDAFEGPVPSPHLTTREFGEALQGRLAEDGILLVNTGDRLARTVFPQPVDARQPTFQGRVPVALVDPQATPGEWTACPAPFEGLEIVNRGSLVQPEYVFAVRGTMGSELRDALVEVASGNPLFREAVETLAADSREPRGGRVLAALATSLADVFPSVAIVADEEASTFAVVAGNGELSGAFEQMIGKDNVRLVGSISTDSATGEAVVRGAWANVVGPANGQVLTDDRFPMLSYFR